MAFHDVLYPPPRRGVSHPHLRLCVSTGEFYGHNFSPANLELIAEFFETYPDYAERAFLSIKVRRGMFCPSDIQYTDGTPLEPKRED
jgi:hypothetical protein